MVTSFVSAPPAPEPPAPEPPPESTKVTVQTLSSAKEMTSSHGGSPRSSPGPEGTSLRQGPPQKPYTFLEEKARQAERGRDGGQRGEWVEHRGHRNSEKKLDCPPSMEKVLRSGSSALLSSDFLWATHCAKLCSHMIPFNLHHLERKPLHCYHHPFHRWEN